MAKSLRLVLDINYDENGVSTEYIATNLMDIVTHEILEGLITQDSPAELNRWHAAVYQEPLPLPPCGVILSDGEDYGHEPEAGQLEGTDRPVQG